MKTFIKSLVISSLGICIAFILLGAAVKAQSIEGSSWRRSAQSGYYSETYTFLKGGKVRLIQVSEGKRRTDYGTYVQKGSLLQLSFTVTSKGGRMPSYTIKNDRLILQSKNEVRAPKDQDTFKRIKL